MYFHVYLIYRFTRTFTDHSSVITRCWGFELQNGKSSLKSPQPWTPLSNPNKLMRLADRVGSFCISKALACQRFLRLSHQSQYGTLKFKPLQIEVENEKARRFEHRCLIWRFCWSFLPSDMASDFSMFDAAFWYYMLILRFFLFKPQTLPLVCSLVKRAFG